MVAIGLEDGLEDGIEDGIDGGIEVDSAESSTVIWFAKSGGRTSTDGVGVGSNDWAETCVVASVT